MNLFEAFGVIKLKDTEFTSGLSKASSALGKFGSTAISGVQKIQSGVVKGMKIAGVAAVGFGTAAIKVGMDYEQSMAQVAATMGITADKSDASYSAMSKAAKDAGATTKFSAGEAAEALNFLALAGFSVTDATTTMPKILNLAAAGNMDLARASDLVTDSMSALGLEVEDVDSFIDQMAKTSQKSNTSVEQLGDGMLTVGGLAKSMAGGTVELSASLGVLADNGIKGAEGGTKLRNMLIELSNPASKATKGLEGMGISAYDLEGNLRPLPEVFGDMNSALDGMTMEEKREIIGKMFNKQDMAAVEAFLGTTPERWDELSSAIENSDGTAKQMADTLQNTLKGSFDQLKSAMSVFAIDFYEGFNTPLTEGVLGMADFVNNARSTMTTLQYAVEQGAISSGDAVNMFAEIFGEGLSGMVVKALEFVPQMIEAAGSFISGFISGLTTNIGGIASAATNIINTFYTSLTSIFGELVPLATQILMIFIEGFIANYAFILTAGIELIAQLAKGLAEGLPELIPLALEAIQKIVDGLKTNLPILLQAGADIIVQLALGLAQALPILLPQVVDIITNIVNILVSNIDMIIQAGITLLIALVDVIPIILPPLLTALINLIIAIVAALITAYPQMFEASMHVFKAFVQSLGIIIVELLAGLGRLIVAILAAIGSWFGGLGSKSLELFMHIPKAIAGIFGSLTSGLASIISKIISAVTGWISRVATSALQVFKSIPDAIPKIIGFITSNLSSIISKIVSTVTGWISRVASIALNVFKSIPDAIPKIMGQLGSALKSIVSKITGAFDGLPGKMLSVGKNIIKGLLDGISSMAGAVTEKVKSIANGAMDSIKGIFKMNSPSRATHEIGKYFSIGLGNGIESEKNSLIETAEDTFGSVLDTLADLKDYGDMSGKSMLSSASNSDFADTASSTGAVTNVTQNIYSTQSDPAALMAEARRQQEWAVLLNV